MADIFLADTKLNVSPYYLRPGGPFRRLVPAQGPVGHAGAGARRRPVAAGAGRCPGEQRAASGLAGAGGARQGRGRRGRILLLGLSFKAGTDDLRNSPLLDLAEILVEAGYDLAIYDPDLDPARLVGVDLAGRITGGDLEGAAAGAQLIVLGKPIPGVRERLPAGGPVFDITRLQGVA